MVALTNLLDQAYAVVLVPVWAQQTGGGAAAVGLLFGGLQRLVGRWGGPRLGVRRSAAALPHLPGGVPALRRTPVRRARAGVAAVGGPRDRGGRRLRVRLHQPGAGRGHLRAIPAHLVGRVSSLSTALAWSLIPFGGLLGGLLVGGPWLTTALAVCGAAYFACTMLPALQPRWREMDRRHVQQAT